MVMDMDVAIGPQVSSLFLVSVCLNFIAFWVELFSLSKPFPMPFCPRVGIWCLLDTWNRKVMQDGAWGGRDGHDTPWISFVFCWPDYTLALT
jgi:hypothetical protein